MHDAMVSMLRCVCHCASALLPVSLPVLVCVTVLSSSTSVITCKSLLLLLLLLTSYSHW